MLTAAQLAGSYAVGVAASVTDITCR